MNFRVKYGFSVFMVLVFLAVAAGFAAGQDEEGFEVSARSFVIMDAKTGKILLSLNPQVFLPPASTLKVMTALVVA
jgi:D-alanyl-D-alanine carboxypeptidase